MIPYSRKLAIFSIFPNTSTNGNNHLAATNPQSIKTTVTKNIFITLIFNLFLKGKNQKKENKPATVSKINKECSLNIWIIKHLLIGKWNCDFLIQYFNTRH